MIAQVCEPTAGHTQSEQNEKSWYNLGNSPMFIQIYFVFDPDNILTSGVGISRTQSHLV